MRIGILRPGGHSHVRGDLRDQRSGGRQGHHWLGFNQGASRSTWVRQEVRHECASMCLLKSQKDGAQGVALDADHGLVSFESQGVDAGSLFV